MTTLAQRVMAGQFVRRYVRVLAILLVLQALGGAGLLYLSLGVLGHFQAAAVGALHLQIADHVFHVAVGTVTLAVGLQRSGAATRPRELLRTPR